MTIIDDRGTRILQTVEVKTEKKGKEEILLAVKIDLVVERRKTKKDIAVMIPLVLSQTRIKNIENISLKVKNIEAVQEIPAREVQKVKEILTRSVKGKRRRGTEIAHRTIKSIGSKNQV